MNRLAHWIMRLYPARWRARYGDELDALLTDTGADARVVTDLVRGGVRQQFKTWSFLKLAVTLGLAGMLIAGGFSLLLPSLYVSKATLQITPARVSEDMVQPTLGNSLNERVQQIETTVESRTRLARILNDPHLGLYSNELRTRPLDDVIEEMRANIGVRFVALSGALGHRATAFDIRFTYPDPVLAQKGVNALVNAFNEENVKNGKAIEQSRGESRFEILSLPSMPGEPVYPSRWVALPSYVGHKLGLVPDMYRSTATIRMSTPEQIRARAEAILSRTSLSAIVNDPRLLLYKDEMRTQSLETVLETMKGHIMIQLDGSRDGEIVTVAFDYPDRHKAQQTLEALLDLMSREVPTQANATGMVMDVLDTASLPNLPAGPNRRLIALMGGLIGILVGGAISIVQRRWKPEPLLSIGLVKG